MVERVKGGVKLFVGRLPVEATQQMLHGAFAEYGEVLEVFLIDSTNAMKGARCAFVRLDSIEHAERAIGEMHERRVLVPERKELGPIQVAYAKGEALRFGLGVQREQLAARPTAPPPGPNVLGPGPAKGPLVFDPDSLTKEMLVEFIKECQRTGGQPFKDQWWTYCDSGKGGIRDYDPVRHPFASLRQFFSPQQQVEWDSKPWFRRAIHRALKDGGRRPRGTRRRVRVRRRRRGSESRSLSSSYSRSSEGSSARLRRKADAAAAAAVANMATNAARIGSAISPPPRRALARPRRESSSMLALPMASGFSHVARPFAGPLAALAGRAVPPPFEGPPLPEGPPPPLGPSAFSASKLTPASERNHALEAFLAKHRISPATSFLMLRLTKEQAATVMANASERLRQAAAGELPPGPEQDSEEVVLSVLRSFGVQTTVPKAGSWTSQQRAPSPFLARGLLPKAGAAVFAGGTTPGPAGASTSKPAGGGLNISILPGLQSLDGVLGPGFEESLPAVAGDGQDAEGDCDGSNGDGEEPANGERRALYPENVLRVKNVDKGIEEREIRELFGRHGTVQSVEILRDKQTGAGKGVAIVALSHSDEVGRAIKALNFTKPWGRALIVERPGGRSPEPNAVVDAAFRQLRAKAARQGASGGQGKPEAEESRRRGAAGGDGGGGSAGSGSGGSSSSAGAESSGWSKYTLPSRERRRRRGGRRKRRGRRGDSRSSSEDSQSCCTSFSELDNMVDGIHLGWPGGPAPFPMPVMQPGWHVNGMTRPGPPVPPLLPPPWDAPPPWGLPPGPPPPMFDEGFLAYDAEEAERQLRRAERRAKREARRQRHEPWEDHPARVKRRQRGSSASSSGSRHRGRRRRRRELEAYDGGFPLHMGPMGPMGPFPPMPFGPGWEGPGGLPPGLGPFGPLPPGLGPPGFPLPPGALRPPWLPGPLMGPPPGLVEAPGRERPRSRARSPAKRPARVTKVETSASEGEEAEEESESESESEESDIEVLTS